VRVHIWVRKKPGMSDAAFADHWLHVHAPIARDGFEHLTGYTVTFVTRSPDGQERPYDGVAEMTWSDREGFRADMASDANARATEDLEGFTSAFGLLFVSDEPQIVK
jgi:uncharacterized protein (TIGR02118 family)